MAIRITSDSTCDLGEIAAARNIGVMPLKVNLDTETYLDGVTIVPQDIFAFVEKTKMLPKTSAPSMTDYEEFFEKELAGYDELIHFSISTKSSVSHTVAKQAAEIVVPIKGQNASGVCGHADKLGYHAEGGNAV